MLIFTLLLTIVYSELDDAVALIVEYMDAGSLQDLVDAGGCANEGVLANIASQVSVLVER